MSSNPSLATTLAIELAKKGMQVSAAHAANALRASAAHAADAARAVEEAVHVLTTAMEMVERKSKSGWSASFKDLNSAAAAAALPADEKEIVMFGQNIKLSNPRSLSASERASMEDDLSILFGSLLDLICKERADESNRSYMDQGFGCLYDWLNTLEEHDTEDDTEWTNEAKELFAIASQLCDRAVVLFKQKGFTHLPSIHYMWALFESEFGMYLVPNDVELEWANADEKKAKFDRLLSDPRNDKLEEDFPGVAVEEERRAKRKAKADAKRSEDDKPSKRAKHG